MTCTNPIKLPDKNKYNGGLLVPCGKCRACRIARAREWATRIVHESEYHQKSVFITLTYNEENLPTSLSLDKTHLQKFFKRLRKGLEADGTKIKYYACGEYGENYGRPHYHAIIFGLGIDFEFEWYWKYGFIKTGTVTYESARYVADYIGKALNGPLADEVYKGKERPFQLFSKGLGKQFALDNAERIQRDLNLTIYGKDVGLPRYYKKVAGIDPDTLIQRAKERQSEIMQKWHDKGQIKYIDKMASIELNRQYTKEHLDARDALRKADTDSSF